MVAKLQKVIEQTQHFAMFFVTFLTHRHAKPFHRGNTGGLYASFGERKLYTKVSDLGRVG